MQCMLMISCQLEGRTAIKKRPLAVRFRDLTKELGPMPNWESDGSKGMIAVAKDPTLHVDSGEDGGSDSDSDSDSESIDGLDSDAELSSGDIFPSQEIDLGSPDLRDLLTDALPPDQGPSTALGITLEGDMVVDEDDDFDLAWD